MPRHPQPKPLVGVTLGDPAGIGPEVVVKALSSPRIHRLCRPVAIGDANVLAQTARTLRLSVTIQPVHHLEGIKSSPNTLAVVDLGQVNLKRLRAGVPSKMGGKAAVAYVLEAADLAMSGKIQAMVTGPLNKQVVRSAGYEDFTGHTELLARVTGTKNYGMMLVGGGLRVLLVTIHIPFRNVAEQITSSRVYQAVRLAHQAMLDLGIARPRIAVAALNPHAGEGGLFGREEQRKILPAVLKARGQGLDVTDPLPADTLFHWALQGAYDVVVAMYHDQGLIPIKTHAFGRAVNVTIGLPIIRTSVDHGTAYDIAGKGKADPGSLLEAVKLAAELARE